MPHDDTEPPPPPVPPPAHSNPKAEPARGSSGTISSDDFPRPWPCRRHASAPPPATPRASHSSYSSSYSSSHSTDPNSPAPDSPPQVSPVQHPSARHTKETPAAPRAANAKSHDPDIPPLPEGGAYPPPP